MFLRVKETSEDKGASVSEADNHFSFEKNGN